MCLYIKDMRVCNYIHDPVQFITTEQSVYP